MNDDFDHKHDRQMYREKQAAKALWARGRKLILTEQDYVPYERQHSERPRRAHRFIKWLREQHTDLHHGAMSAFAKMRSKKHAHVCTFWSECRAGGYRQDLEQARVEQRRTHRIRRRDTRAIANEQD